jgi:hypothetical protein
MHHLCQLDGKPQQKDAHANLRHQVPQAIRDGRAEASIQPGGLGPELILNALLRGTIFSSITATCFERGNSQKPIVGCSLQGEGTRQPRQSICEPINESFLSHTRHAQLTNRAVTRLLVYR